MANVTLGTLRDYWKALSDIIKTGGAATGTAGLQVAGSDGTKAQILKTNADGELLTTLTGSNVCLSTEEKPVGVQGDTLLEYNTETKETKVYKYISGDWREL